MSKNKNISLVEVYKIKASGNPDKIIADGVRIKDLHKKTYLEKVEFFRSRIQNWFFDTIKPLIPQTSSNFLVIAISCILIDLFTQYHYGVVHSSKSLYIKFFEEYLRDINNRISPPIKSYKYNSGKWEKIEITSIAEGFYYCFRCGVLHSARIMEYGRINRDYESEIIKILDWNSLSGTKEINVHAPALFLKLEQIFNDYIKKLKEENEEYKINFLKRYNFEYGIIEKYNNRELMIDS